MYNADVELDAALLCVGLWQPYTHLVCSQEAAQSYPHIDFRRKENAAS
jgi:hypothetical protein